MRVHHNPVYPSLLAVAPLKRLCRLLLAGCPETKVLDGTKTPLGEAKVSGSFFAWNCKGSAVTAQPGICLTARRLNNTLRVRECVEYLLKADSVWSLGG